MSYASVWINVPGATAWVMIGLMVACCTLGSICRITGPPRWIKPSTGGFSFSSGLVPADPGACDTVPAAPFFNLGRLTLVPGHDIDLIDLSGAFQLRSGCACHQTLAEMPGHGLHVRGSQTQFLSDLPIGEVQPHPVEAQHPHAQWLVMSRQHRAG